ncbi:amidohydrolase family protein [Kordiimonas aquimaris]|uniref:amidohydrolase family protein n=1 Tax=Kordiimonas aquimaris TaxID=707591 RepID=UPI0021D3D446|nr:amidohydrolase family protein [Kordiimonas aquimaris]
MKQLHNLIGSACLLFTVHALTSVVNAEDGGQTSEKWDTTLARGETRQISFTTEEGTFMSLDVSPDGEWVVFDLLAHVYRMPIEGGEAESLTQNSGVAVNYHPSYSPDGKSIAFISDRAGQDNLWVMDADGKNPRQVSKDLNARFLTPKWSADGSYIYARKRGLPKRGSTPDAGIWMFHKDGGKGIKLIGREETGAAWPSASADGDFLYFHKRTSSGTTWGQWNFLAGEIQISRLNLQTGDVDAISHGTNQQQSRFSSGGAGAPELSPDGKLVAFVRRIPDGTISYKGHKFGPRSALWVRNLETGAERLLMDPVEQDMTEGMKTLRIMPGYSFAPDGKSIVISQGGQFRRVDVASGEVATIPFSAKVDRTISGQAYKGFRITDDPFESKFLRWTVASPDGSKLAFQAVGKIWVQDLPNGMPQRLTADSFAPFEFAPAWSPDGRTIAFTSWDDIERGQVWTVRSSGGRPKKITSDAGEYINPDWSVDGKALVVAKGSNATARGREMTHNSYWDVVRMNANGGDETTVGRVDYSGNFGRGRTQLPRPTWGPDGRIFFLQGADGAGGGIFAEEDDLHSSDQHNSEQAAGGDGPPAYSQLVSVPATPTIDPPRVHASFDFADEAVIAPNGRHVAFLEGDNVYVSPLPYNQSRAKSVRINKYADRATLPVKQLSKTGGLYPNWRDSGTLEYGSAATYYAYDVASGNAAETNVSLTVEKRIPAGSIAFTNARILTMRGKEILEGASIVVSGSRITCVGACDTAGADQVIDATGKTLMPGMVDMHAHHFRDYRGMIPARGYETAIYTAYGVTTALDNAVAVQNVFPTAELIDAGKVIGPRTYSSGGPLYNRDGARENLLTSYTVAEDNVRRLKSWGAVSAKQYLQPRRDQRQWVSDIARNEGLMVTSEGGDLAANLGMIMDGQTGFEHPMSYQPLYSDAAKFFGQAGAVYSPTFAVGGPAAWNEEYFWGASNVWQDKKQQKWLPWRQLVPNTRRAIKRPDTDYGFPLIAQGLADVIAEGGFGAIGSHGQQHGIGAHWETWMVASAMGAHGALEVATRHGAYFLGALDDIGTLEVGKLADIVVLNSNPLDNIRNTLDIEHVMQGGIMRDADTLDEVWPNNKPFGARPWDNPDIYRNDNRPVDYHDK